MTPALHPAGESGHSVGVGGVDPAGRDEVGLRLIVIYKLGKAGLQTVAALTLWLALRAGLGDRLVHGLATFADHTMHPLAARLGLWLSAVLTPGDLHWVVLLLGGDALVSAAEGWILRRRYRWGRWLVVASTALLLPLELYEMVSRPRLGRVLLFLANVAIVAYLIRSRRGDRSQRPSAGP